MANSVNTEKLVSHVHATQECVKISARCEAEDGMLFKLSEAWNTSFTPGKKLLQTEGSKPVLKHSFSKELDMGTPYFTMPKIA